MEVTINTLSEAEILWLLGLIELGIVPIDPVVDSDAILHLPRFTTEDGWLLCVFNDAGEWDYLEWARSPDGREWRWADAAAGSQLQEYIPPDDVVRDAYGFCHPMYERKV